MLELTIKEKELFHEKSSKFIRIPGCTLMLEHSLISLAKWESKWKQPFFSEKEKTEKQRIDYIKCMTIGSVKDENIFIHMDNEEIAQINKYINDTMTATTFNSSKSNAKNKHEIITAEVIYARMAMHGISFECQKWHLNRLLTLIKVCDLQNAPKEKMSKADIAKRNAELNAARKAKYNTRG